MICFFTIFDLESDLLHSLEDSFMDSYSNQIILAPIHKYKALKALRDNYDVLVWHLQHADQIKFNNESKRNSNLFKF